MIQTAASHPMLRALIRPQILRRVSADFHCEQRSRTAVQRCRPLDAASPVEHAQMDEALRRVLAVRCKVYAHHQCDAHAARSISKRARDLRSATQRAHCHDREAAGALVIYLGSLSVTSIKQVLTKLLTATSQLPRTGTHLAGAQHTLARCPRAPSARARGTWASGHPLTPVSNLSACS